MSKSYVESIRAFQKALQQYISEIFKCSANELILRLEELNLLNNKENRIESSTALGYIVEEFLVSKLDDYTLRHDGTNGYRVQRPKCAANISSYDCWAEIDNGIRALVNLKVSKNDSSGNNGVAAIQQLYHDYVKTDSDTQKCYLVVKVEYSFCDSIRTSCRGERAISITDINSYFLDEIDFSNEHRQDNRKWSATSGGYNSGRLQITNAFRKSHQLKEEDISYTSTVKMLNAIYNRNLQKENA